MKWSNIFKVICVGLVLLLLYLEASQPNVYLKLWFAVFWGVVAIITLLRIETIDWLAGKSSLKLPQPLQFAIVLLLVLAAIVATDWASLSRRDLLQWVYVLFTLPVYKQGFTWAWSRVIHPGRRSMF
ncbi:MAG TPA: hypothetical protein VMY40_07345 [Anaerolineae bacterium]|nr:hypothetical protein [Anaerolineae bacterium]